jgi:hypothetical protein
VFHSSTRLAPLVNRGVGGFRVPRGEELGPGWGSARRELSNGCFVSELVHKPEISSGVLSLLVLLLTSPPHPTPLPHPYYFLINTPAPPRPLRRVVPTPPTAVVLRWCCGGTALALRWYCGGAGVVAARSFLEMSVSHHRCRKNGLPGPPPRGTQIASYRACSHVHRHGFMMEMSVSHHRCLKHGLP